jgi:translation initiation factor 6
VFKRLDPFGNPNVGVYARSTSTHLFTPPGLTAINVSDIEEAVGLKSTELTLGGSELLGSLMAANKFGAVVADLASDKEIALIESTGLKVVRLDTSRLNAAGNNILCNDHGAVVHPDLSAKNIKLVETALGVPVERSLIGGLPTVGTAAFATNRGVLAHPLSTEAELAFLKRALGVHAKIGTVNHGHGLVGAGLTANQNGVAVGSKTTGIELGRIDEALGFLD